jgi:hypothetical protein
MFDPVLWHSEKLCKLGLFSMLGLFDLAVSTCRLFHVSTTRPADMSPATTLPTLNTQQVGGQSPSRAARLLSKKRRIFKKTICHSFPHFPQILRDTGKTRSELV